MIQQPSELEKKAFKLDAVFDVLYLVIMLVLVVYAIYIGFNLENYIQDQLITISYWYIPIFFFSLLGIMAVRSTKSLVYAVCGLIVSLLLVVFFYQAIWPLIVG